MKHSLIICDIDDTVLRFSETFEEWVTEHKGYSLTGGKRKTNMPFETSHESVEDLITEFSKDVDKFGNISPEPDALAVIPVLYEMGYQFAAISACVNTPEIVEARRKNLEQVFGIEWFDIHCVGLSESKVEALWGYHPSYWVEDHADNAIVGNLMGHTTFIIDRLYNQIEMPIEIIRVPSWHQILEHIKKDAS